MSIKERRWFTTLSNSNYDQTEYAEYVPFVPILVFALYL